MEQRREGQGSSQEGSREQNAGRTDIQVVDRIAQIFGLFSPHQLSLRLPQVASTLGVQRSTAHRYLTSMVQVELLRRNEDDGTYSLGPLLLRLWTMAGEGARVLGVADPYMRRLAEDARQTVVLSLWGGRGPVVAQVHEDKKRLVQIVIREGSSLPLDSAQGQVFLAHHSDRALMESLLSGLPLLERTDLELRVARTREQGLAINSRVTEGIRAIAAPVFDERMKIRATLALVGTLAEIPEEPDSVLAHALMDTAEHVSHDLGASVSPPSSASGQGASPPGQRDEK